MNASAKHLRAKDRAMNHHVYPRIHYPEVYILKGGYSAYFEQSARFSEPRAYVRMDDPAFARDRRQDLDAFRVKSRFGRTRSYAYGEMGGSSSTSAIGGGGGGGGVGRQEREREEKGYNPYSHQKRNTAPTAASILLPPAELSTRTRRAGSASASAGSSMAMGGSMLPSVPSAFASLRLASVPDADRVGGGVEEGEEEAGDESYLEQKHGGGFPGLRGGTGEDDCVRMNGNGNVSMMSDDVEHDLDTYADADSSFNLDSDGVLEIDRSPCPPPLARSSALGMGRFGLNVSSIGRGLDFGSAGVGGGPRKSLSLQRAQTLAYIH